MFSASSDTVQDVNEEHTARQLPSLMSSNHGRPLSTIESIASSAEDEDGEEELADVKGTESRKGIKGRPDLKTQVDELMRLSNSLDDERTGKASLSSNLIEGRSSGSIRLKDLPRLLAEYEKEKGEALLNDEARPVLDDYVQSSPDVVLQADSLQQMIAMLNETRAEDVGNETIMQAQEDMKPLADIERRQVSTTSESETDVSSSNDDDFSYDSHQQIEESVHPVKAKDASSRAAFHFPRSQSEKKIPTKDGESGSRSHDSSYTPIVARSKRTTSDPSAPSISTHNRRVSASAAVSIGNGKSETRGKKSSNDGLDKEILRGKGKAKAPPLFWSNSRPRPPALARRDLHRRISDLSNTARSDDYEQENVEGETPMDSPGHQESMLGMGTPSRPPRHRLSSQPEVLREVNNSRLPRSASSASTGFIFPRALSLQFGDQDEDRLSEDDDPSPLVPCKPRKTSSRAASPGLDEQSYHNFSALSPTFNNEYPSSPPLEGRNSRRSSGAGRRRTLVGEETDASMKINADSFAVRARLEAVSRQLTEKERQYDAVQQEHESFISRLQDELEESKLLLSTKRREEKESKARENSHMDSIASLEADLNKTEKALETTREQLAKSRADYDEQVMETGRLRGKLSEVLVDVERLKTEERMHLENVKMWDSDRESYREKISLLHTQIDKIEDESVKLQDSERENKVLKEQLERLMIEMDELRRGSSLMGSIRSKGSEINGTLSKRLSSELARQLAGEEEGDSDDTEEGIKTGDGDESVEHIYLVERRKSRKSRGRTETQQTSSEPPTYDEAAHEKQVSDRLHPSSSTLSTLEIPNGTYKDLVQQTGRRCTVMESRLQSNPESRVVDGKTTLVLFRSYWHDVMLQLISYLPASIPQIGRFKALLMKENVSRGMTSSSSSLLFAIALVSAGLALLVALAWRPQQKTFDLLNEDWGVSNALDLSWGFQRPPSLHRAGILEWLAASNKYDPTIRVPT